MKILKKQKKNNTKLLDSAKVRTEIKKIDDLLPSDYNPRKITKKSLAGLRASIKRFGLVQHIVWNEATGRVVGGHQRLLVLQQEGVEEVDVVVVNLANEKEEKALNLSLNNPNIAGDFTEAGLDMLDEIRDESPDIYESVGLRALHDDLLLEYNEDISNMVRNEEEVEEEFLSGTRIETITENMDLQPYEHHDYLLVLADDSRDFNVLLTKLGIGRVNCSPIPGEKRIGLGRCISASKLLDKIKEDTE